MKGNVSFRTAFPFLALREVLTRCIAEFESCFSSCLCLQTKTIDPKRARCLGFLLVSKRPVGEYSLYLTLEGLEGSQTDRHGGFRPGRNSSSAFNYKRMIVRLVPYQLTDQLLTEVHKRSSGVTISVAFLVSLGLTILFTLLWRSHSSH